MADSQCLAEEVVAELVEGRLEGEQFDSAERHIASCDQCMRLVDEAGGALATGGTTLEARDGSGLPPPLPRGARVGRYEILEPVGAGGMGRVYAALDPVLDRRVALKLLHPHAATDELETRLLREAKAMARLSHPEVITVHDAGRFADQLFIAMEFVEGWTLRRWLLLRRRPWREVLAVFVRAGRGLARAHEAGIIHRDFKPDNVLVGEDGRVRVTDFGLARSALAPEPTPEAQLAPALDRTVEVTLTRTGTLLGTPAYMAPEQHEGQPADERSDVFSFCVALYEGLYGVRPFVGSTLAQLAAQKREGKIRVPRDERGVPQRVRRVVLIGLRPEAEQRHASMNALLEELQRASRPPRAWIAAGAAGVVLLGGGLAFAQGWGRGGHGASAAAGASVAAVVPSARECTSHAACAASHGGQPYACRASDGVCVPMASEDCTPRFEPGDLEAADTVWLGAMFPVKGPAYGKMNMDGVDMARAELARETGSLSGSTAAVHVRRVALVECDDKVDGPRAARHLVDDLGVPAILGFGTGQELVELAGSLLIQRHVLSVATLTESPAITRLPQPPDLPRMVWRTSYNIEAAALATAAFVRDVIEPRSHGKARVTLVRPDGSTYLPFAEEVHRELTRDERAPGDDGSGYGEVVLGEGSSEEPYARAARAIVDARPKVVVFITSADQTSPTVEAVERDWPAGTPRPVYVLAEDSTQTLGPFIGTSAERRHRVFATGAASVGPVNSHFVLRFNLAHPGGATETINPGGSYDAFYLLAYAIFTLGERDVTGPTIAAAIPRLLPPGRSVQTGPTDVFPALSALAGGENIDLSGPSGSLDFDPVTGEWMPDFALLCPAVGTDGRVTSDVESGVTFLAKTRKAEGTLRCP